MTILSELRVRFCKALAGWVDDPDAYLSLIQPASNPQFGDYQANCAMPLGKKLGRSPRELAAELISRLDLTGLCEPPDIAGPGFINLRLRQETIQLALKAMATSDQLGVSRAAVPRSFVIDFSSPNVAKPMHVGHIRSTVLGDSLARTLRFAGHQVITDNHLGDWGTQFGMIIYGYKHFVDPAAFAARPIEELGRLYRFVRKLMDSLDAEDQGNRIGARVQDAERALAEWTVGEHPDKSAKKERARLQANLETVQREARELEARLADQQADKDLQLLLKTHRGIRESVLQETALLHAGNEGNLQLWRLFLPSCRQDIQRIYSRLGITFDHELGESFYHDQLARVVESLASHGLTSQSEGAVCLFLDGFDTPMIVQKRDGAYLYSTSDLATIVYRVRQWNPDTILYVVDFRQSEHFAKLFAAARRWGYDQVELRHIAFGTVLGSDQRPFQTRSGDTVGLEGLLDEAERRAYDVVHENNQAKPSGDRLDEARCREIARVVGIAAIKYADLSQNRTSDYVFSYDKMLSLTGNTAAYLQYSYARVQGILQRGQIARDAFHGQDPCIELREPAERALALQLLRFGDAIDEVLVDYRPNLLTSYLYELARSFSSFYETCPVLAAERPELQRSRLALCQLTARTIKQGLELLGIEVVEQM